MKATSPKALLAMFTVAVTCVFAYWYFSPYLALRAMREAAVQKDANAFNAYVNYPKLRESVRTALSEKLADQVGIAPKSGSAWEALGSAFSLALVKPMIDAVVRPEFVMTALTTGKLEMVPTRTGKPNVDSGAPKAEPQWEIDRQGASKLVFYAIDPERKEQRNAGLVFERSGFVDWKLSGLQLPGSEK